MFFEVMVSDRTIFLFVMQSILLGIIETFIIFLVNTCVTYHSYVIVGLDTEISIVEDSWFFTTKLMSLELNL